MIFEEPLVEFVAVSTIDTGSTSGGMSGTDTCNGNTSEMRNCAYPTAMDQCGITYHNGIDKDENTP